MAIAGVSVVCFNQLGPQLAIAKELGLVKVIVCTDYERSIKPFFIEISKFWAWADKLDG